MRVLLLLCASLTIAAAGRRDEKKDYKSKLSHYSKSDISAVFFGEEAASNRQCRELDCKPSEVCIVFKSGNATCMKEKHWRKSMDTNRFHKHAKSDKISKTFRSDCQPCPVVKPEFICGTDNVTYSSQCRLDYKNCVDNTDVKLACQGRCPCKKATETRDLITSGHEDITNHQEKDQENHVGVHLSNKKPKTARCTKKEMKELQKRLVEWFHVVVRDNVPHGYPAESLRGPAVCTSGHAHGALSWMFEHYDDNKDGKLSLLELFDLEADKYEHCVNALLERCDVNSDLDLSGKEWCSCFQGKIQFEKKPRRGHHL